MTEKNGGKRSHLKKIRDCDTGEKELEVRNLLLNNDKNSVIADKKFSLLFLVNNNFYFLIPKCRFTKDISFYLF